MQIVEFTAGSLRFVDAIAERAPADGFVWVHLERAEFTAHQADLQAAAGRLGGSPLLDVHARDLTSDAHPSSYDATSVYDLVVFRRLATLEEVQREQPSASGRASGATPDAFARIASRAVGFAVFDRLLISVHPSGCGVATSYVQRLLADARLGVDVVSARNRVPQDPTDLVLRMVNGMVDSYLELRKSLTSALEQAQGELLRANPRADTWDMMLHARHHLNVLQDLCEEQQDAMQEWLDTLRELPLHTFGAEPARAQARRDQLVARARDVMEHIDRVLHHARRLEQAAETAMQIHFSAQAQRTNDIMRVLTAVTAVFLPLNLFTGFFGMNFDHLPLIHSTEGMWLAFALLVALAVGIVVYFWRRRYLSRTRR